MKAHAAAALCIGSCLALSGCIGAALTASVPPDASMRPTLAETGLADIGEGMVAGSIVIGEAQSPQTIIRWGDMNLSPEGIGREIRYAIRLNGLDRRGLDTEGHRGAACYPGKTCRFVSKLRAGSYRISNVKLWAQHVDVNDPGSINKRLDYRFTVEPGEVVYLGRFSMLPPVMSGKTPVMPVEVLDHRDEDLAAIGFDPSTDELTFRSAILQSDYDAPLSYEPPWQWKLLAAPGSSWEPETADR